MNSKIIAFVVFALFSLYQIASGLKCYSCTNDATCKKPTQVTCTQFEANQTQSYLSAYYKNVATNFTNPNFDCMRQNVTFVGYPGTIYRGCVYRNVSACSLQVKDHYLAGGFRRDCKQCNFDLCNGSGEKFISTGAVLGAVIVAVFGKIMI